MGDRPTLLVVGAASRDLDVADPRGWRLGGAVSYASIVAAHLGLRVRALIGVDDVSSTAHELDVISAAGVEVRLVTLERAPVFDNQQRAQRGVQLAIQPSDRIPADALPADWRQAEGVLLGPVAGELGDDWASSAGIPEAAVVALAWQGLLRKLVAGQEVGHVPLRRTPLVALADLLLVSVEDAAAGGPPIDELLDEGQELVVTAGRAGGIHAYRDQERRRARHFPAIPAPTVVDSTGAGDVFLAAWLSGRLLAPSLAAGQRWRLLALAAVMASLSVGRHGLAETPTARDVCGALLMLRDQPPD